MLEDGRLVIHIPDFHCQGLRGGEAGLAPVCCLDGEAVGTLGLVVQRGGEIQKSYRKWKRITKNGQKGE